METDNVVLQQLRAIRKKLDDMDDTLAEHGHRLNRIEQGIAGFRREQAYDAENTAHHSVRIDKLDARIGRIERRLALKDDA